MEDGEELDEVLVLAKGFGELRSFLVNLDYLNLSFEGLMNIDGVLSGLANRSFVAVIRDLQDLGVFFVHRVGDRKARRTASGLSGIASSILEQF